jgi:cell division protease FtsH
MKKNTFVWILAIVISLSFVRYSYENFNNRMQEVAYSDFLADVKNGNIAEVLLYDNTAIARASNGAEYRVNIPRDAKITEKLELQQVRLIARNKSSESSFWDILFSWLPTLLIIGVWIFIIKKMGGGGGGGPMGFIRSGLKLITPNKDSVNFNDVAGVDEAKQELEEVVDFLKDPQKFQKLGGKIPKGVLLVGPPGTGKTMLAKAVAGESGVPFFSISGSQFVEMFVGVGASRVRDMFEQARKNSPCVVFIDEIDAVGRKRGNGGFGADSEKAQTLNQMLVEMDGIDSASANIIIIAATNSPDILDPALLRPGRFDRHVTVPIPDIIGRERILRVHSRNIPLADDVNLAMLARGTPGCSGADLANIMNEAAIFAAKEESVCVNMRHIEYAKDKVLMGKEKRSSIMRDEEKKLTAYHEAGHAIIALKVAESDPIYKATILPRGRALGFVLRLPEYDRYSYTRQKVLSDLRVAMGGRAAEEIIFGYDKITTGASSDIQQATSMARAMVREWGLNDKMGMIKYTPDNQEGLFSGDKTISEETAREIDIEVKQIIDSAYADAVKIINDNKKEFEMIAEGLLEHETLSGDEINDIIAGKPIKRFKASQTNDQGDKISHDSDDDTEIPDKVTVVDSGGSFDNYSADKKA